MWFLKKIGDAIGMTFYVIVYLLFIAPVILLKKTFNTAVSLLKRMFNALLPKKDMCFVALGPRGSGKTTLLSCMCKKLERERPGTFYPDSNDRKTVRAMFNAYDQVVKMANSENFDVGIEATGEMHEYKFKLLGQKDATVRFFDFPGGWMNVNNPNFDRVVNIMKQSAAILVAINTPYIMEGNRADIRNFVCPDEIAQLIKVNLEEDGDKLVLLVPIKCEKYTRTPESRRKLHEKIKEVFSETLRITNTSQRRLAMALIPVQTVGCMDFEDFKRSPSGQPTGERYQRNGDYFNPRDVEQPLYFMLSFLLSQFEKGRRQRFLSLIFPRDAMKRRSIENFVRESTRLKDFAIFSGGDLIGGKNTPFSTSSIYPGDH